VGFVSSAEGCQQPWIALVVISFQEVESRRSRRCIEIGEGMVEKMRRQLEKVNLTRLAARKRWQENDLVFP
jgi:hypothetical protein